MQNDSCPLAFQGRKQTLELRRKTIDFRKALESGRVLVLDGGIGSEIQHRGFSPDPRAWTGFAHMLKPDLVQQVHSDYIAAGAQIITANTFSSARHILETVGLGEDFELINRTAIDVAKRARDAAASEKVWIAGSISTIPPLDRPETTPRGEAIADNYKHQAEILANAGVDLLIAEMMLDSVGARMVVDACTHTGLPVLVGCSASFASDGETVQTFRAPGIYTGLPTEPFAAMVSGIIQPGVCAVGVMHTKLPVMRPALEELSKCWTGATFAYAETGNFREFEWDFEECLSPDQYAKHACDWIEEFNTQIVGGCCGTAPEHIRAITQLREIRHSPPQAKP